MSRIKKVIKKAREIPLREKEVEIAGEKFRLRELRSAAEFVRLARQYRLLPAELPLRFSTGEEVKVPKDLLFTAKLIKACLVQESGEEEITETELCELAHYHLEWFGILARAAEEVCGINSLRSIEDFFAQTKEGGGEE
jgi:hypothetical protein